MSPTKLPGTCRELDACSGDLNGQNNSSSTSTRLWTRRAVPAALRVDWAAESIHHVGDVGGDRTSELFCNCNEWTMKWTWTIRLPSFLRGVCDRGLSESWDSGLLQPDIFQCLRLVVKVVSGDLGAADANCYFGLERVDLCIVYVSAFGPAGS
jgi:hypothetical protein